VVEANPLGWDAPRYTRRRDVGALVRAYPLDESLLAVVHVRRLPEHTEYTVAATGAPEAIATCAALTRRSVSA
jgi:hypothetical protein